MAKEIILGGVPREDLDEEGNFLEGREEYNRKYNRSWGGYRGEEEAVEAADEVLDEQPVEAVEASTEAPEPRKRKSVVVPVEPTVEVAPEPAVEQTQE